MAAARGQKRIKVAAALDDSALRDRLAAAFAKDRDFATASDVALADIVVARPTHLGDLGTVATIVLLGEPSLETVPASVHAILPADATLRTIVEAVRLVSHGLLILPAAALADAGSTDRVEGNGDSGRLALTPRETEVLELLASGASNKLIARRLGVSIHTAKFHVASLLRKLGAGGRLEAVGIGLRAGLLML